MTGNRKLVFLTLIFSILSLIVEQIESTAPQILFLRTNLGFLISALLLLEILLLFRGAPYKAVVLKQNSAALLMTGIYIALFLYRAALLRGGTGSALGSIIIIRNLFLIFRVFSWLRRMNRFLQSLIRHPALIITVSFLLVILVGTLLLMMPFTTADGRGLSFLDSLFTATSAVCVTGLIVVDTAAAFTLWGQAVILILIQIGGLGLMLLSLFSLYALRRKLSLEDKLLIAYIISEDDMTELAGSLRNIVILTFSLEAAGALLLLAGWADSGLPEGRLLFYALFHSVSAFCNAGFALFSGSLEPFSGNPLILFTVAGLIIAGGLSFSVITDLTTLLRQRVRGLFRKGSGIPAKLSLNSKTVLGYTAVLIGTAFFALYALEHRGALAGADLGEQYLGAFFQAVTLRTAGFNSFAFTSLAPATYLVMALFMFIGGASGSTAGGIKVNTLAVLSGYIRAAVRGEERPTLFHYQIGSDKVMKAFLILLFGILAVAAGTIALSLTEKAPLETLFFEAVSAFGTVGLSAGLTSELTAPGRIVVTLLMFIGRTGPLTLMASLTKQQRTVHIEYPRGEITLG